MSRTTAFIRFRSLLLCALLSPAIAPAANYYVSTQGSDTNPGTAAAPWRHIQYAVNRAGPGDTVLVKAGTYKERVDINRSGRDDAWLTLKSVPGAKVVIDGTSVSFPDWWNGLIDITKVSYVRVDGLRVQHSSQWGIIVNYASNVEVLNSETYDTFRSGIAVWHSSNVLVHDNDVELAVNGGDQECITIAGSDHVEVTYNEVFNDGAGTDGGEGIDVKHGSSHVLVRGNYVHDLDELGIYVDAWDSHTHDIVIDSNLVHSCNDYGIALASERGGLLENVQIHNNVVYRNASIGIVVSDWDPDYPHPMRNIRIINNTSTQNGQSGDWGAGIAVLNKQAQEVVIRNNIAVDNGHAQILDESGGAQIVTSNNMTSGMRMSSTELATTNTSNEALKFVDAYNDNFRLSPGSAAINAGTLTDAPATDFMGHPRGADGKVDIGAFEYQSEMALTPPALLDPLPISMGEPAPGLIE